MSRYVDADDVLEMLNLMYDEQEDKDDPYNVGVMGAINYIKHRAPSIDIVRCKECKYEPICSHSVQHTTHESTSVTIGYKSVDFCSYGERKEGE